MQNPILKSNSAFHRIYLPFSDYMNKTFVNLNCDNNAEAVER